MRVILFNSFDTYKTNQNKFIICTLNEICSFSVPSSTATAPTTTAPTTTTLAPTTTTLAPTTTTLAPTTTTIAPTTTTIKRLGNYIVQEFSKFLNNNYSTSVKTK